MKNLPFYFTVFLILFANKLFGQIDNIRKCEIVSIDSIPVYYLFKTREDSTNKILYIISYRRDCLKNNIPGEYIRVEKGKKYDLSLKTINTFYVDNERKISSFFPDKDLFIDGKFFSSPNNKPFLARNIKGLYFYSDSADVHVRKR